MSVVLVIAILFHHVEFVMSDRTVLAGFRLTLAALKSVSDSEARDFLWKEAS